LGLFLLNWPPPGGLFIRRSKMKVFDIAKDYGVKLSTLYMRIYNLEIERRINPIRQAGKLHLGPKDVSTLESELKRLGYKKVGKR